MTHAHKTHKPGNPDWLRHVRHWLSGLSCRTLPPIFGDPVPSDLKVFQAEVEETRHEIQEVPAPPAVHNGRSKPARRTKSSVSSP